MSTEFFNEYILEIVGIVIFLGIWFANTLDAYATGLGLSPDGDGIKSNKQKITIGHAFAIGFAQVFSKQTAMFLFNVVTVIAIVIKFLWTILSIFFPSSYKKR